MPLVVLYWCVYSFVITVSIISCRFMKLMYILVISVVFSVVVVILLSCVVHFRDYMLPIYLLLFFV